MKLSGKGVTFFSIFVILGLIIVIQARSIMATSKQNADKEYNVERLAAQLEDEKKAEAKLKEENKKWNDKRDEMTKSTTSAAGLLALQELEKAKFMASQFDVKGPGIILTMNDAAEKGKRNIADYVIHDADVYNVLNDFKKAGAQAISINNERLLPTSENVCAGPTIKINKNRYAVPFEIKVIGDSDALKKAFDESEYVKELKKEEYHLRLDFKTSKEITIPKYNSKIDDLLLGLEVIKNEK